MHAHPNLGYYYYSYYYYLLAKQHRKAQFVVIAEVS